MMKLINLTSLGGACAPEDLHPRLSPEPAPGWGGKGAHLVPLQRRAREALKITPKLGEGREECLSSERFCWFSLLKNYLNISNVIPSHT